MLDNTFLENLKASANINGVMGQPTLVISKMGLKTDRENGVVNL